MIGWISDLTAAEAYFKGERLESTFWDALTAVSGGKDEKTAVLVMAYNRIRFCRDFEIPKSPTATQLEKLSVAQCEAAYYLAAHLADEDRRKGLQAQGVSATGVVKENYEALELRRLALPAIVYQTLDEFMKFNKPFYSVDIDRDEDSGVSS